MTIQNAKTRIQTLIQAGSVTIRNAPSQPVTNADAMPISLVYLSDGQGTAANATQLTFLPVINADVHFPRTFLKQIHGNIDTIVSDFMSRLAGDPTLNANVDTIVFPVTFSVLDDVFDEVETKKVSFSIPVKLLVAPVST